MKIDRILSVVDLKKEEWNNLLRCSGNKSVFVTWEWLTTWWEVYGGDKQLWWITVRNENGILIGSAPLYLRHHQNGLLLPHREMRFVGTGEAVAPEHLDILADQKQIDEVLQAIGQYLLHHQNSWDVLLLTDLTSAPSAFAFGNWMKEFGGSVQMAEQLPPAPYIKLPQIWEEYFKSLGKWLRRTIVRQRNKQVREFGMSVYLWSEKTEPLETAFDKFEKLYALRKKSAQMENKFEESRGYRKFHRLLASRLAENGWLNLAFLKLGNREVACEYTFKYLDTLYSYQCGFDPAYGRQNVFKVLRSYVIEHAINEGIKEFDLLRGNEAYKYDWKAVTRTKQMLRIFSPTFSGSTLRHIEKLKKMGKRWLSKVHIGAERE